MCFQKTKTDDLDDINIEGFEIIMKNRIKYGRVNSGGIMLAFRQNLSEFITVHVADSKTVLWFEISKTFTNLEKNLFVGIYIPPENSRYNCVETYWVLLNWRCKSCRQIIIILTGDFNAKTGILLIELCKIKSFWLYMGVSVTIPSKDTCKNSSVVDYFLCDYSMYKYVSNMRVFDQSSLFSDNHTYIVLYLDMQKNTSQGFSKLRLDCAQYIKSWDPSKEQLYIQSIDNDQFNQILYS